MSSQLLKRRAMLQSKIDKYEGCEFGITFNYSTLKAPLAVLPAVEVPSGCTLLRLQHNIDFDSTIVIARTLTGSKYVPNTANSKYKEINPTQSGYVGLELQMSVNVDEIDDCYILDKTNDVYLWKGKNVT